MSNRYEWFAWHEKYLIDTWFLSLTPGQKWAWVAFLSWANRRDWSVEKCDIEILSRRIEAVTRDIRDMLKSAIDSGKVIETSTCWQVKNGNKHRQKPDATATERQARKRAKDKDKHELDKDRESRPVTGGHASSRPVTQCCQDKDKESSLRSDSFTKTSKNPPTPQKGECVFPRFVQSTINLWNVGVEEYRWNHVNIEKHTNKSYLIGRIKAIEKEPDFDIVIILDRAKKSEHLVESGYFTLGWLLKIDKKETNDYNYRKVLAGKYDNAKKQPVNHSPGMCRNDETPPGW